MAAAILFLMALACAGGAMAGPDVTLDVYTSGNCTSTKRQVTIQQSCYTISNFQAVQTNCTAVQSCVTGLPDLAQPEAMFKCFFILTGLLSISFHFNTSTMNNIGATGYLGTTCTGSPYNNINISYSASCSGSFDGFGTVGCLSTLHAFPPTPTTSGAVAVAGTTTDGPVFNSGSPASALLADIVTLVI